MQEFLLKEFIKEIRERKALAEASKREEDQLNKEDANNN